jgi:hypothetical protein
MTRFSQLCQTITYTAKPTFLTSMRDALSQLFPLKPTQERIYHITMRYQGRVLRQRLRGRGGTERPRVPTCQAAG